MQRLLILACLAACENGQSTGTGVVAFTQPHTLDLAIVDVATGDTTMVDDGEHGVIAISPDRGWITSNDLVSPLRLFATDGSSQRALGPSRMHSLAALWPAGTALLWSTTDGLWFVPTVDGAPRSLLAAVADVSRDGTMLAYLRWRTPITPERRQDLIVEAADGSGSRTLASDVAYFPLMFSADGRFVIAGASSETRVLRYSVADGSMTELSLGRIMSVSADGTELLIANGNEIRAVDIASGAARPLARLPVGIPLDQLQVVPLDRDRVVYVESRNVSTSDVSEFVHSIHVAEDGEDRVVRAEAPATSGCMVAGIARESRFVAVSCGGAQLIAYDGTVLATDEDATTILGVSADERGVVTIGKDHTIRYVGVEGERRDIARIPDPFDDDTAVLGPFAAYAP